MANSITTFKKFIPLLDEVYKAVSKTAVLDGDETLVQAGANANELVIPKLSMDGLADYSRNSGYVGGDAVLTNETVTCGFDRGRMFVVDSMDDAETAGVAFGMLASEFIRLRVAPELDAYRFAQYASAVGVSSEEGELTDGADVAAALRTATNSMDESEVPMEDRVLFITPTLHGMLQDMEMTYSREVLSRFSDIILVPQTRFYTSIAQMDGVSENETVGGYVKADDGLDINFMIVHKGAVIQYPKHIAPKVVPPEQNPDADAWKFGYRHVGVADVYDNKLAGIYVHAKPAEDES